jgi:sec-independent protein translocase protein TatB
MLDFSWSHILIVLIVALAVVGPKDLPRLMRLVGQWAAKARAMAGQFRRGFDDLARESELNELRKEIRNIRTELPQAGSGIARPSPTAPTQSDAVQGTARAETNAGPRETKGEPQAIASGGYKPSSP